MNPLATGRTSSPYLIVAASTLVVLAAGVFVPGGGLVVALVLAFTVLRENTTARKVLIGLGVVLLLLSLGSYSAPWTSQSTSHSGTPVPAERVR